MKTSELKELLEETFGHLTATRLMALTIYGEARGESKAGKIAVGSVILERVDHRKWDGTTITEVCLFPFQFSCFLPNDPNFNGLKLIAEDWNTKYMRSPVLQECYQIADGLINGDIPRTKEIAEAHCCQYKTIDCVASWTGKMKLIATINHHQFFA